MPQYFFHIRDGETLIQDEEGAFFEDFETARSEAYSSARDLAADQLRGGVNVSPSVVQLTDETGMVLLAVPLRSLVS